MYSLGENHTGKPFKKFFDSQNTYACYAYDVHDVHSISSTENILICL